MVLTRIQQMKKSWLGMVALLPLLLIGSTRQAHAASLSFSVNGTSAATGTSLVGWANFVLDEKTNRLMVQVINGSGNALTADDILGGIFFTNKDTKSILTPSSAALGGSSAYWNAPNSGTIGQNWAFNSGIAGPNGSNTGIASRTYGGLFSKGNFASSGNSLSNINYGIANGIDKNATSSVKNGTFVQNEIDFYFDVSSGYSLDNIRDVYFQFGTTTSGPRLFATLSVPEPGTVALLMTMGSSGLLFGVRKRRLRRTA